MASDVNDHFKKTMQFMNKVFSDLEAYLIRYHVWFRPIAEIPI